MKCLSPDDLAAFTGPFSSFLEIRPIHPKSDLLRLQAAARHHSENRISKTHCVILRDTVHCGFGTRELLKEIDYSPVCLAKFVAPNHMLERALQVRFGL